MAHPGGRPTKYHDGIPALYIQAMKAGKSIFQFAAQIEVCVDTVYEWRKVHKEFSEEFIRGKTFLEAHWEDWLDANLANPKINAALVKLKFANRFGWSDKKEQNISLTDATPASAETKAIREQYQASFKKET